ncbi:MAG: hypothetical protein JJU00_08085 [Opitutales bacterium]|nr:hypothetical protein [Opitutales bacterium]
MKSVNIRTLKHETGEILQRVGLGESIVIRRRNQPLAALKPLEPEGRGTACPDFRKRLRAAYGDVALSETATELLGEERGNR